MNNGFHKRRQSLLILSVWAVAITGAWAAPLRDIRVEAIGDVPVSAEQVLAHVSARVGQELDRAALSRCV